LVDGWLAPGEWTRLLTSDMLNMEGLKLLSLDTTPEVDDDDADDEDAAAVEDAGGKEGGRGRTKGLGCA